MSDWFTDEPPYMHYVIGGGTLSHVRSHLALAAPAYGQTAKFINEELKRRKESSVLYLTRMADPNSRIVTSQNVKELVDHLVERSDTKTIFFNPAIVDFDGQVGDVPSDKYAPRLQSRVDGGATIKLTPSDKIISTIRRKRKDIFVVGFKTTRGATMDEQYVNGLRLVKQGHVNLVLANDVRTRMNMVIVPEEARYHETSNRDDALNGLITIALKRAGLNFTRSTVLKDKPRVGWQSDELPENLRSVVNHLIARGAYKPFLGKTAGHFAARGNAPHEFLTSARSENFNELPERGLVRVFADSADEVTAHGAKPSVGGQSQRIIFDQYPDLDNIVHFHAPLKPGKHMPTRPQWMFECGSHECGRNTAEGLEEIKTGIFAVMLDNHGPNIVFGKEVPAADVISVIERNWDLEYKTGGLIPPAMQAAPAPAPV